MYTAMMGIAVSFLVATKPDAQAAMPDWLTDYSQARVVSGREQKPMAVVISTGAQGWNKVVSESAFGPAAQELLRSNYVCVYVDMQTSAGKQLAEVFELTNGTALVLSDRGGVHQTQRKSGPIADADLGQLLSRNLQRTSMKVDSQQGTAPAAAPVQYFQMNNCPSCRG